MVMGFVDYLVLAVIAVVIGGAVCSIRAAKKKGQRCIGCPHRSCCSTDASGCGGTCGQTKEEE